MRRRWLRRTVWGQPGVGLPLGRLGRTTPSKAMPAMLLTMKSADLA
jgi:hypothetical protein